MGTDNGFGRQNVRRADLRPDHFQHKAEQGQTQTEDTFWPT